MKKGAKLNIVQMIKAGGLQVPQIIVTEDRDTPHIPSVKIRIECVSSSDDDDDEDTKPRARLRPNAYRLARTCRESAKLTRTTNDVSCNVTSDRCLF